MASESETMRVKMTVDEAIAFADEWSSGMTLHADSQGWRVVCLLLAKEVRKLRAPSAEAKAKPSSKEVAAAIEAYGNARADFEACDDPAQLHATYTTLLDLFRVTTGSAEAKDADDDMPDLAWIGLAARLDALGEILSARYPALTEGHYGRLLSAIAQQDASRG